MNLREKLLAAAAGTIIVGFMLYGLANSLLIKPARQLDAEYEDMQRTQARLQSENAAGAECGSILAKLYTRTYGGDESDVNAQLSARLDKLIEVSGLSNEQLTSSLVKGATLHGTLKDKDLGRSISLKGKLPNVVNLLYLLSKDSHLHRIDTVAISPLVNDPGKVDLQLKYSTIVMDIPKSSGLAPTTEEVTSRPVESLDAPERARYDVIVARDIMRPYVARPKPPEPVVQHVDKPPEPVVEKPQAPKPPPDSRYRVAGLPTWFGTPAVNVRDNANGEIKTVKIGETLGEGKVVAVDYRLLPKRNDPKVFSDSRVIVDIGGNYWAVDIGDSLADKYMMKSLDLPPELRKGSTTVPAGNSPDGDGKSG